MKGISSLPSLVLVSFTSFDLFFGLPLFVFCVMVLTIDFFIRFFACNNKK